MSWKVVCSMQLRAHLVTEVLVNGRSVSAVAREHDVSRKTAHKWLARVAEDEEVRSTTLEDRSRRPHRSPAATPAPIREAVLAAKSERPHYGPKKLKAWLEKRRPDVAWPAASTMGEMLRREGLTDPRKRRARATPTPHPLTQGAAPNDVWACDFKGHFALEDKRRCHPLTVTDDYSRYLLACEGLRRPDEFSVHQHFERLFRMHGLPRVIRSDNGSPFASNGVAGLSRLSVWWLRLGIRPERIAPASPQQNGRHERMHRTLKAQAVKPGAYDLAGQQALFDAFVREYNEERPHEALSMRTPSELWQRSERVYPERLPEMEYAKGFAVRRVTTVGCVKFLSMETYVSESLIGELVGLRAVADGVWGVWFGEVELGSLQAEGRGRLRFHRGAIAPR